MTLGLCKFRMPIGVLIAWWILKKSEARQNFAAGSEFLWDSLNRVMPKWSQNGSLGPYKSRENSKMPPRLEKL